MIKLFSTIIIVGLISSVLPLSATKTNASQPCIEEPDQEPERLKLLLIVQDQASLEKVSAQEVVVVDRLVCNSGSTIMRSEEWQGEKLSIVKTKADLLKYLNSRVQIIGKYVVTTWSPGINSNTAEFRGVYRQASIELEDGTLIPIMPPSNKLSLRSAAEVGSYGAKRVKIVGQIKLHPDNPATENSTQSVMLMTVDGIWLN
jgi:hypothetical protein